MSLARALARPRSGRRRACVLAVLFALLALVPLAHASPPDPVWLAGIYDAGDLDDLILAATSLESRTGDGFDIFRQASSTTADRLAIGWVLPDATPRTIRTRAPPAGQAMNQSILLTAARIVLPAAAMANPGYPT